MIRTLFAAALTCLPMLAGAEEPDPLLPRVIDTHVLPRIDALALESRDLAEAAEADCAPDAFALREAYHEAFDAWVKASHLRFGPTEEGDRAFALAFWPDSRGATPRTLGQLIESRDPVAQSADTYADMSIAARGFYALEYLLYDDTLMAAGDPDYRCMLVRTVTADIAQTAADIAADWHDGFRDTMLTPGPEARYRSGEETVQELFKTLTAGLQFTSETRLGRPLGSFDRPRPTRAEARRSMRSARHVRLSLTSLRDLALMLSAGNETLRTRFEEEFQTALDRLDAADDPVFAGVADPQSRLRLEIVQQAIDAIRETAEQDLGPSLGVAAGFNSLDGD
ncbi:imelysin family protein [Marivita sp. GX14005]|uniref:imelysin family protein n=1 Tax=Marivita sp. GX14005 TaxID=2942276 RepID=UPI00201922E8|nr:imelysin family protein [Marivita sp. GX14005]MCL3883155.1 imelysin family protein [Marivita sp. GX14005]